MLLAIAPLIDQSGVRTVTQLVWADVDRVRSRIYAPGVRHQVLAQGSRVGELIGGLDSWGEPADEDSPLVPLSPGRGRARPERVLSKDRRRAEVLIRERAAAVVGHEDPVEATEAPPEASEEMDLPGDREGRLQALTALLGRAPTQQELDIYQV